jgi:adenylate kinase
LKNNTELGILAKSFMDQGKLVPDEVTIDMLKNEVMKQENPKGFIFDGFPRTIPQATALDQLLTEIHTEISIMLALDVEEEELKVRLKNRAIVSGRTDDADPEVISQRISVYKNETAPVKEFYAAQNKFVSINGIGQLDEITQRLYDAIDTIN